MEGRGGQIIATEVITPGMQGADAKIVALKKRLISWHMLHCD